MQLLPASPPPSSIFRRGPFPLAHDRESRAVDNEMQAGTCGGATQREVEMLATPGERGVIGRGQVETQHPEDRRQEAFSLPQGQVEGIVRLIRLDPKNLQSRTIRLQVDATRPGRRLGLV